MNSTLPNSLPKEMTMLNQWVNADETNKLPMQSKQFKPAQSDNPDTWSDFNTAFENVVDGTYKYLGFVFNNNNIVGIDIDLGYDDDGLPTDLMIDCMSACGSYTEKSKSGRGIHILVKGVLPFKGKNNRKGCEIYQAGRYFIMTGKSLVFHDLIENQQGIDYIIEKYFSDIKESDNERKSNAIYHPIWEQPHNGIIPLRPTYPVIEEGGRNISLASLAGVLHTTGYNSEQIYDELCFANQQACRPPLDDYEIRTIVNSICRYRRD